MKKSLTGAAILALSTTTAMAAGLDRSNQSVLSLFAQDGYATTGGLVYPSVTGTDALGNEYDAGEDYVQFGATYTRSVGEKLTFGLIYDQPYGADVAYNNSPNSSTLGGTSAELDSHAIKLGVRYKINDRISVFGGIGAERIGAEVTLNGLSYRQAIVLNGAAQAIPGISAQVLGAAVSCTAAAARAGLTCQPSQPLAQGAIDAATGGGGAATVASTAGALDGFDATDGYKFEMENSTRPAYFIGAAYEIPNIALRIAGTYQFETEHSADTTENLLGGTTRSSVDFVSPQSFNLEAQTGIAPGTLLTASYRWTEFSAVDIIPTRLGSDLVNLDDSERYTLGIARQFNDEFAGSATLIFEPEGDDEVSPLAPTNGSFGISLGGQYTTDTLKISGGLNYTWIGDAKPTIAGNQVASFTDNHAVGLGFKAEVLF